MDNHLKLSGNIQTIFRWVIALFLTVLLPCVVMAEFPANLPDPTRPNIKQARIKADTKLAIKSKESLVLQSTLVGPGRRSAIINGKSLRIGGHVADAQVLEISPHQVVVLRSGIRQILRLLPENIFQKQALKGRDYVVQK